MKQSDVTWRNARCAAASLAALTAMLAGALSAAAIAQDIPGIEICTHESRMDRRTGCLQSNVEFLQQQATKNARDAQQKLSAAGREIAALKEQLAAANREAATLRAALTSLEARIAHVEKTAPKPDAKAQGPDAKAPGK